MFNRLTEFHITPAHTRTHTNRAMSLQIICPGQTQQSALVWNSPKWRREKFQEAILMAATTNWSAKRMHLWTSRLSTPSRRSSKVQITRYESKLSTTTLPVDPVITFSLLWLGFYFCPVVLTLIPLLFCCLVSMSISRPQSSLTCYKRLTVFLAVLAAVLLAVDIGLGVYCKSTMSHQTPSQHCKNQWCSWKTACCDRRQTTNSLVDIRQSWTSTSRWTNWRLRTTKQFKAGTRRGKRWRE